MANLAYSMIPGKSNQHHNHRWKINIVRVSSRNFTLGGGGGGGGGGSSLIVWP